MKVKGQLRSLMTAVLTLAVSGTGSSGVLVAQAADTPPVINSIVLSSDAVNEGGMVRIDVAFSDPGATREAISVFWGDGQTDQFTWMGGAESFFLEHTYGDDFPSGTPVDAMRVTVEIDDLVNPAVRESRTVTVSNVPPVITSLTANPPTVVQGQTVSLRGAFADPSTGDTYTVSIDWGDGSPLSVTTVPSRLRSFSLPHEYRIGGRTFTITATLTDDDTGFVVATVPVEVTVLNTPPTALSVVPGAAFEGAAATLAVSFDDPDTADTHRASIEWGDGSSVETVDLAAGVTSFRPTHVYADSGSYTTTVVVADSAASTPRVTAVVSVANVAPTVLSIAFTPPTVVERDTVSAAVTFADPGASDTFTLTISWGDGASSSVALAAGATSGSATHAYQNAGPFVVTATVTDSDNGAGSARQSLEVRALNRPPSGLTLTATSPTRGSPATLTGSFDDPDTTDTHTVSVNWGDGATATLPLAAGVKTFTATHTYANDGTYRVAVTVTDPAGLSTSAAIDLVVKQPTHNKECERLSALRRWLDEHAESLPPRTVALLERLLAALMARFHCDQDGDSPGVDSHPDDPGIN